MMLCTVALALTSAFRTPDYLPLCNSVPTSQPHPIHSFLVLLFFLNMCVVCMVIMYGHVSVYMQCRGQKLAPGVFAHSLSALLKRGFAAEPGPC